MHLSAYYRPRELPRHGASAYESHPGANEAGGREGRRSERKGIPRHEETSRHITEERTIAFMVNDHVDVALCPACRRTHSPPERSANVAEAAPGATEAFVHDEKQ